VATDVGGDGFHAGAELVELDGKPGEGKRLAGVLSVFFHDGAELRPAVEGGPSNPGSVGDRRKGDRCTRGSEFTADLLDAFDEGERHAVSLRVISWSIRATSA